MWGIAMFKKITTGFMLSFLCFVQISCCSLNQYKSKSKSDITVEYLNNKLKNNVNKKLHNQNFVFLSKYVLSKNNNDFNEICYIDSHNYNDCLENMIPVSAASGYIFKVENKTHQLYALTAAHWCMSETKSELYDSTGILFDNMPIVGLYVAFMGKEYRISSYVMDPHNDLCIVKFKSKYSKYAKNIKVSKSDPEIGEKVYTISAPLWSYEVEFRQHYTGYFSGCDDHECAFTIPATYGSSGSAVINENGEIISIISRAAVGFNNYAIGAKPDSIKKFIEEGI
jgi:hypothetical protein